MGVDLTLMPLLGPTYWVAHDMLDLERRSDLWPAIANLAQLPVPGPLTCYKAHREDGETEYGPCEEDPYGDKLKYTTPEELLKLKDHHAVNDNWQNRAVWAYLTEMPPHWPIVLYWH